MAKILLVDDNRLTTVTNKKFLVKGGHEVDGVLRAKKALELLESREYEIVLTDVHMPDMTGLELIKEIDKLELESKPLVCMLTSNSELSTIIEAMNAGAADYLVKPVDVSTLIDKMLEIRGVPVEKKFAKIKVISAEVDLLESKILPEINIQWITEFQLNFLSDSYLTPGESYIFQIKALKEIMGLEHDTFVVKINDCHKYRLGHNEAVAEFIGLHEKDIKKIRAWAVKGQDLNEDMEVNRKSA